MSFSYSSGPLEYNESNSLAARFRSGVAIDKSKLLIADIDEAVLATWQIPAGKTIVSMTNARGLTFDEDRLIATLRSQPGARDIRVLSIDFLSRLISMSIATAFPSLKRVVILSGRIKDMGALVGSEKLNGLDISCAPPSLDVLPYLRLTNLTLDMTSAVQARFINQCHHLKYLMIRRWKEEDFRSISSPKLECLRLVWGRAKFFDGIDCTNLKTVWLDLCGSLLSVRGLAVPDLKLESCNSLDLDTIADVQGLQILRIASLRKPRSLAFIPRCPKLWYLSIAAPKAKLDFTPIIQSSSLQHAYLQTKDTEIIKQIATANPRITISNGDEWFENGLPIGKERQRVIGPAIQARINKVRGIPDYKSQQESQNRQNGNRVQKFEQL